MRDPTYVAQTGWTAANLQAAVNAQSFFDPFSLVTLQIGVNDQYQGLPLAEYETTLDQLLIQAIQLVGGSPDRVIAVSIPDWSVTPFAKGRPQARLRREIDSFNHVFSARATEVSVCLVDITPLSRQARHAAALLAVDGLHPSGRLYRKWADLVLPQALAALSPGHLRP
jgi:lysophospholipase L1-like esterase